MAELNPYLNFDGTARQAMESYRDVFGGDLAIQTFGDAGQADDPKNADRVMHAVLKSGPLTLMASDTRPGEAATPGDNTWLNVNCDSEADIDRFFSALAAGGKTVMELQNTFWGARFGMLTDRYGINWMFNFQKEGPAFGSG
ncbi:MAG: VOC family protein [Bauldia sp.]